MSALVAALLATGGVLVAGRGSSAARQPAADFSELEKTALQELQDTGIPGVAIGIVAGDRLVYARGLGVASVETGAPITPEMLFPIGSATKLFTAAAVVGMAHDGALKLEEPIGIPVRGLSRAIGAVTLHQLLSHTSGLGDQAGDYGLHDESALGANIRQWKDELRLLAPGQVFSYSNPGFALAGFVMQEVAGKPYADVMAERLFGPLGMVRSTFRPTVAMTYPLALGHRLGPSARPVVVRPFADDTRIWPAGYMYSSLNDLARFAIALLNEGRIDGKPALPAPAVARLSAPHVVMPNIFQNGHYGYGLILYDFRGVRILEHGGNMPGFSSLIRIVPSARFAMIMLTNEGTVPLRRTSAKAMELMLPLQPAPPPQPKPPIPMSLGEMGGYAGTYINRGRIDLLVKDGRLYFKQQGQDRELEVTKIGDGRFVAAQPGASQGTEFVLAPASAQGPGYLHLALWAFRKVS